jgi:transposase-like protein
LSIVESAQDAPAESTSTSNSSSARPAGSRRPRLTQEEQREIARLYSESGTSTSAIRERFGIGESSLYRVLQQQNVALRGRSSTSGQSTQTDSKPAAKRQAAPRRAAVAAPRRAAVAAPRAAARPRPTVAAVSGQRFAVHFKGEQVVQAADIEDAIRLVSAIGQVEILSVSRER